MFTVVVYPLGGDARELTPVQESLKFTTAAVGGFGNCNFNLLGDRRRDVPKLALLRVFLGAALAWEGRIEDHGIAPADDPVTTSVTCYGLQRRLSDVSVRRIWSKRDLSWQEDITIAGVNDGTNNLTRRPDEYAVSVGSYDPTDQTKIGVQVHGTDGNGATVTAGDCNGAICHAPVGLTIARLMYDFSNPNGGHEAILETSSDGVSWGQAALDTGVSGSKSVSLSAGINTLRFIGAATVGGFGVTSAYHVDFSNIRVLGTALTEDAAGGFYGGTILNDLVALVPGLSVGLIEAGSNYTIPAIERAIRDTSLSVVSEVAGYYSREWAVWEDGVFSWVTPNLDEPQWIIPLEQLLPGTHIETSIDTLASHVYVLFTEALDANTSEQTAAAIDERNPLVKAGLTKDELLQAPAVMTDNTASQLATMEAANQVYAPVTGTVVLNARALVQNAVGSAQPAALIRAGTNVYLPGLPKTDSVTATVRRDGETLFHIVTTDLDMDAGTVTLELEGQARQIDVITARLAASTRVVTG